MSDESFSTSREAAESGRAEMGSNGGTHVDARAMRAPSQQLFEQIFARSPDGLVVHDGQHVITANLAMRQLIGTATTDDVIGQPINRLLQLQQPPRPAPPGGVPPTRDMLQRLDGQRIPVEVRTVLLDEHPESPVCINIRDISGRLAAKQLDREVADQLHAAQRRDAVAAVAGGVAHEVNNMMQVVIGIASLLRETTPSTHAQYGDLQEIIRAASHSGAVTRQLLEFSRSASHHPVAVPVDETLLSLAPMLHRLVGVTRNLLLAIGTTPLARMDVGQFEQVVMNLLLNARQSTIDGGVITLTTRRHEVEAGRDCAVSGGRIAPGSYVAVSVSDNGMGMDEHARSRAFEPFFTTKSDGVGLGLSSVFGIMSQHGGCVTIDSAPGRGTTVTTLWPASPDIAQITTMPAAVATPRPTATAKPKATPLAGMTILVVDDEDVVRVVVRRMLERAGAVVRVAVHGADALKGIETDGLPTLVITDMVMPEMGGQELMEQLRARWPALPVLVMSGYPASPTQHDRDVSAIAVDLPKPFTMDVLLQRMETEMRALQS